MKPEGLSPFETARKDLDWLEVVGALRKIEPDGDGFVVTLPEHCLLALTVGEVPAFRRGVLVGYRLPRAGQVLG